MEEAVAATILRLEAVAQVVPVLNCVHRLIADDLLQDVGRRGPVDRPQHQKPPIEPGREQMAEVGIDAFQLRVLGQEFEQLLAHPHQRRCPAGSQVEAPDQLLPPGFRRGMQPLKGIRSLILTDRFDGELDAAAIRPKAIGKGLEEGQTIGRIRCRVGGQQGLCECYT